MIIVITLLTVTNGQESRLPKITYPGDTIIFQPRGILFPTLNYGHLRTTINISAMRNARELACQLHGQATHMVEFIQGSKRSMNNLTMGTVKLDGRTLRDIENKIKSNKAIPTAGFEYGTFTYRHELEQNCNEMTQDIRLIDELFLPRKITASINHLHAGGRKRSKGWYSQQ